MHRGANQQHKPENALARAKELVDAKHELSAIQTIQSILTSRRHRTWSQTMEELMLLYLDICVETRKGKLAKDALIQFRSLCQTTNTNSLETVSRHFLTKADKRVKAAQEKADKVVLDVDDLEANEAPEAILLQAVSGEDDKDRADRQIVTPWLKFLWETYRTVLEIARNNNRLESLYQDTAQKAFEFCLTYTRTTEFRRLCDILRNHVTSINKSTNPLLAINLHNPDSLQAHLETRFAQLKAATELELWQEAFRSIEDIHGLMGLAKRPVHPSMVADYYEKLTKVFWVAGNYLCHAYAWFKYFTIQKNQNKSLTHEDAKLMATHVLLATLTIPPETAQSPTFENDIEKEKNMRMAQLLNFNAIPERSFLIKSLVNMNLFELVNPLARELYSILEVEFHPLQLCSKVSPLLQKLQEHPKLAQYVKPLQKLSVVRLLQQLSQVYSNLRMSELMKMAPFVTRLEMDRLIVTMMQHQGSVRLDHRSDTLYFDDQTITASVVNTQLLTLTSNLSQVVEMLHPERKSDELAKRKKKFAGLLSDLEEEHEAILGRKQIIEEQKQEKERLEQERFEKARLAEEAERLVKIKEEEERVRRAKAAREAEAAKRLKEEAEEREKAKLIEKIKGLSPALKNLEELDTTSLLALQQKHQTLERELAEQRLRSFERKMDHTERAKRRLEAPKRKEEYIQQKVDDLASFDKTYEDLVSSQRAEHARGVELRNLLTKIAPHKDAFEGAVRQANKSKYETALTEWQAKFALWKVTAHRDKRDKLKREAIAKARRELEEPDDSHSRAEKSAAAKKTFGGAPSVPLSSRAPPSSAPSQGFGGAPPRSFNPSSSGPRPSAFGDARPSAFGGDRPRTGFGGDRGDKPGFGFGGDRPGAFGERSGGFGGDRGERPSTFGGDRGERPSTFGGDRGDRGDRPSGGFGGDRGDRPSTFGGDRGERPSTFGGDRGERPSTFGGDRGERPSTFGGDRGERPSTFGGDRGERPSTFGGDRGERPSTFGGDRGERPSAFGGDRGERPSTFGGDRGERPSTFGGDRGERPSTFGGDRGDRPSGGFGGDRGERPSSFGGDRSGGFGANRERPGFGGAPQDRGDKQGPGDRVSERSSGGFGGAAPDRPGFGGDRERGDRPGFGGRSNDRGADRGDDKPSAFNNRPSERPGFGGPGVGGRGDRPSFGGDRGDRPRGGDRPAGDTWRSSDPPAAAPVASGEKPGFGGARGDKPKAGFGGGRGANTEEQGGSDGKASRSRVPAPKETDDDGFTKVVRR